LNHHAAWTSDHKAFTAAVINPPIRINPVKLKITGADLSGLGTLWRLASTETGGQNPGISISPLGAIPDSLTLPRFSVSTCVLAVK
jgi:hypothetical protein